MTSFGDELYCKNLHYDKLIPSGGATAPGAPQNLESVLDVGAKARAGPNTQTIDMNTNEIKFIDKLTGPNEGQGLAVHFTADDREKKLYRGVGNANWRGRGP